MKAKLKKLSLSDGMMEYQMLKEIDSVENSFTNPVRNMNYEQYCMWLKQQEAWSRDEGVPEGYVGQTIFWLYVQEKPIGIGKIRHSLTDNSKKIGGNIGYAISKKYRGKGYGNVILKLLLNEAKKMNIRYILLTVDKYNYASKKVIEKNGGKLEKENKERWYFSF